MCRGHRGTLDPTAVGGGWSVKDIPVGAEYDGGGGQVWVREAIPGRGDSVNKDPGASSSGSELPKQQVQGREWQEIRLEESAGAGIRGPSWTTVGSAIILESPCGVQAG